MYVVFSAAIFFCVFILRGIQCQMDLTDFFSNCHKSDGETFDNCIKDGLNSLRPYYKSGLPDYGILPLDPFFAVEIPQKVSNSLFNYKLILRNVTESGWTISEVTKFKTDPKRHAIVYTQFFPDKKLNGWYEIEGNFFGRKLNNKGTWNLNLYDFIQTTTVTRKPFKNEFGELVAHPPLKVQVMVQSSKNMELHIGHLAGGRTLIESALDWVINTAWQPGFLMLRPLINDLVSTAFTEIFNKGFQKFPFETVFQKENKV